MGHLLLEPLNKCVVNGPVLIPAHEHHDLLGTVGEFEGRDRLIHAIGGGRQGGDHTRFGIAAQRVLQEAGES
eukprot:CAMPEP_0182551984 /NCGR_PEP_ID=MMETSP1323-20130603/46948_1 /TAXON_ID=236787 /ORGANISM="Florenciella parvula, Strain RCC1693" /LENGTH=71 /DNA_ID=CAMNT_0024763643 /DNA_START=1 /DNA_END=216 /DNA_ORIENTATION=-